MIPVLLLALLGLDPAFAADPPDGRPSRQLEVSIGAGGQLGPPDVRRRPVEAGVAVHLTPWLAGRGFLTWGGAENILVEPAKNTVITPLEPTVTAFPDAEWLGAVELTPLQGSFRGDGLVSRGSLGLYGLVGGGSVLASDDVVGALCHEVPGCDLTWQQRWHAAFVGGIGGRMTLGRAIVRSEGRLLAWKELYVRGETGVETSFTWSVSVGALIGPWGKAEAAVEDEGRAPNPWD